MRVDFMIIGAQKCGTTTLAQQIADHPDVCFCRIKEPGYFNQNEDWHARLDGYHALYQPQPGQLCGEGSTMYTFLPEWPETHNRLHAYNPDLKLIYIMRHPVERVISNYAHRLVRDTVRVEPEVAVFADPAYMNRTRYGVQLRPYLDLFSRKQVLPLIFEEYITNQVGTLQTVSQFLEIDAQPFVENTQQALAIHRSVGEHYLNPTSKRILKNELVKRVTRFVPMAVRQKARQSIGKKLVQKPEFSRDLRQLIWRFLEDDVKTVESIIGRRLDSWRKGYSI